MILTKGGLFSKQDTDFVLEQDPFSVNQFRHRCAREQESIILQVFKHGRRTENLQAAGCLAFEGNDRFYRMIQGAIVKNDVTGLDQTIDVYFLALAIDQTESARLVIPSFERYRGEGM